MRSPSDSASSLVLKRSSIVTSSGSLMGGMLPRSAVGYTLRRLAPAAGDAG
jgi:hypothetical protein